MKKSKKPKEVKYIVTIHDGTPGGRSTHVFREEYAANEFFNKMKFAIDILNDDWYFVSMDTEEVNV